MQLAKFDIDLFLRDFWQKKPLLIRNAWNNWKNPVDPDELAGIACEEHVESRLILQSGKEWQVEHGPLAETRFGTLGQQSWTLLVNAVDHHIPAVAALVEPFRFIPDWRIDDVMVSYAADQGGVGPHFDQYDVFLIQGLGKRRWQLGGACDDTSVLAPHEDLRLLDAFEVVDEWIVEPGDILYVPPRVAHNGVATGTDCMTYSVGFRAPSRHELIAHWCDHMLAGISGDDDRYEDPDLPRQENPGEISRYALNGLHRMMAEKLLDHGAFARWFGQYNSTPKYPETDWRPLEPITTMQLQDWVARGVLLSRNPASRFSFIRQTDGSPSDRQILLFVDGQCFECVGNTSSFAESLCAQERVGVDPGMLGSAALVELLLDLCNQGSVAFDEDD